MIAAEIPSMQVGAVRQAAGAFAGGGDGNAVHALHSHRLLRRCPCAGCMC